MRLLASYSVLTWDYEDCHSELILNSLQIVHEPARVRNAAFGVVDEADQVATVGMLSVVLDIKNEMLANLLRAQGCSRHLRLDNHAFRLSVVDCLNTKSLKSLKVVLHGLEHFGGVPLPICDLARDPQRFPGAV
jgi:hypothetical protein